MIFDTTLKPVDLTQLFLNTRAPESKLNQIKESYTHNWTVPRLLTLPTEMRQTILKHLKGFHLVNAFNTCRLLRNNIIKVNTLNYRFPDIPEKLNIFQKLMKTVYFTLFQHI